MNFRWVAETAIDRFAVDAAGSLRAFGGPGTPPGAVAGFQSPQLGFDYTRTGADGSFRLTARWREDSIRSLRSLEDFLNPDTGEIELPDDFDALVGTGTRSTRSLDARLSLGERAPLGFTLGAGITTLDYSGAAASLIPATRARVEATARLRLSPVATGTVGLRLARFTPEGGPSRDSAGLTLGYAQDLPDGQFGIDLAADRRPEGTRLSASVRRSLELPQGAFGFALGLARPAGSSRIRPTGSLSWRQELPRGGLSAQLQSTVSPGADDIDRTQTALALSWTHALGPSGTLAVNARHAVSRGGAASTATTTLGASYSHALTPDLGLVLGYTHRTRSQTPGVRASGDLLFLTLRRNWN